MNMLRAPVNEIRKALEELSREELLIYTIYTSIAFSYIGSLVTFGGDGIDLPDFGMPEEKMKEMTGLSFKVRQRVAELVKQSN